MNLVQLAIDIDDFQVERTVETKVYMNYRTKTVERKPVGWKEWIQSKTGTTFYMDVDDSYDTTEDVVTEAFNPTYNYYKYLHGIAKQGKTTLGWLLDEKGRDAELWQYIVENFPQE